MLMMNSSVSTLYLNATRSTILANTTMAASEDTVAVKCDLTNTFGFFIQGLLAVVAFSTLILKRFREPKNLRRPLQIWFYDTSKQAIGALVIHFANVYLSTLFKGDPCTWYFINYLLDSTIGLCLIYIFLQISQFIVHCYKWDTLILGEYGKPPQCDAWIGQCGLYILIMILEKMAIALLVMLDFWHDVRRFILKPVRKYPKVEVALVMLIVPFIINAIMFWVVDNFLMRKAKKSRETNETGRVQFSRVNSSNTEEVEVLLDNSDSEHLTHRGHEA